MFDQYEEDVIALIAEHFATVEIQANGEPLFHINYNEEMTMEERHESYCDLFDELASAYVQETFPHLRCEIFMREPIGQLTFRAIVHFEHGESQEIQRHALQEVEQAVTSYMDAVTARLVTVITDRRD